MTPKKETIYEEKAARYDSIESLITELVMRHRGDISEVHAQALGDEATKRVTKLNSERNELRAFVQQCADRHGDYPHNVEADAVALLDRIKK